MNYMDDFIEKELNDNKSLAQIIDSVKKDILVAALERYDYNISRTAIILRVHRNTIDRDMQRLGIKRKKDW